MKAGRSSLVALVVLLASVVGTGPAFADPVQVEGSGEGEVISGITVPVPGSGGTNPPAPAGPIVVGGGGGSGVGTSVVGGGSSEPPGLGDILGGLTGSLSCTVGQAAAPSPLCPADPAAPAAPPPPDPAVVAQQLREQVRQQLPKPSLTVSPDLPNTYRADIGYPVTFVNLWFWVWASPEVWQPQSRTLTVGGITVTTTATPVTLGYDPGNGDPEISCASAGRPWEEVDGSADPNSVGGCGYLYEHVTPDGPIVGTLSIDWVVTWTVNGVPAGALAPMTTATETPEFVVAQIQVVNCGGATCVGGR